MTPTEDLIHEHNTIRIMLSIMSKIARNIKTDQGFDTKDIEKIIDFIKTFADKCHHGKEETSLFPALVLAGIPLDNGPVGVMLNEHNIGRGYINGLVSGVEDYNKNFANSSGLIEACLTNYVNLFQDHIQKEEDVLFPMTNKVLNVQKQNEIFEQFEIIKEEVVGNGVHEQYLILLNQLEIKYIDSTNQ